MKPKKSSAKPKTTPSEKSQKEPAPASRKSAAPPENRPATTPNSATKPSRTAPKIPPALLEEDKPASPAVSGPGTRYALGPKSKRPAASEPADLGELPDSYGTQRVLAAARDPHW